MTKLTKLALGTSMAALTGLSYAAPAFAQSDDIITVTAQRRSQNILDVPISVTAVSGDTLESIGAIDITAVQALTPNTTIEPARGSNSTVIAFIRGVGQQDPLWGFEPGVGIYVDDVYVARPQGAVLDVYDVERIEVLRGPQGTLYGRNTIGGAIKYVTKSLDMDAPHLDARINVGSYGQFDQVIKGSVPITDTFALGAAFGNFQRNGFGENLTTGEEHYDKDVVAGRVSAEWQPTERFNLRLAADFSDDSSSAKHGRRLLPSADGTIPVTEDEYDTYAGMSSVNEVQTHGFSGTVSYDVSDAITLKSITAYRKGETETPIDFDALPQMDFDVPARYSDSQFSQEFQLLYSSDNLNGVVGLYYLDGTADGEFDAILAGLFGGATVYTSGEQIKENLSAYADFTYDVNDALSVSLGGRYTEDTSKADVLREFWLGIGSPSFDSSNAGFLFATQTDFKDLERKDTQFSPRIAVNYKVTPDTNVYASFSKGFKAGGFDPRARGDLDPTGISRNGFAPEIVDSYEIGVKGSAFDNRLTYSLAGFIADYKDQQITVQEALDLLDAAGNPGTDGVSDTFVSSVFNAGKSKYQGIEFEGALRVTDDFTLTAMGGYIDAEVQEVISAGANIADLFVAQNTPELTGRLGFAYNHDLADNGSLLVTGSANYRDEYFLFSAPNPGFGAGANATFASGPALDPESATKLDLGVNWTSESGHVSFGVFGRNLTDRRNRIAAYNFVTPSQLGTDGAYSAFYGAPRTVTATLGLKY